jgi:uncharacterized delta-60 repeat protein
MRARSARSIALRAITAAFVATLVASPLGTRTLSASGHLDTTFGGAGVVTTEFPGFPADAYGVAIQADGKIVVAGSTHDTSSDFVVARYNTDGTLDSSFGGGGTGWVMTDLAFGGPNSVDEAYAVAIDENGKILVAGSTQDAPDVLGQGRNFALVRYNGNGSVDTMTITNVIPVDPSNTTLPNPDDEIHAIAIDPVSHQIIAVGHIDWVNSDPFDNPINHHDVAIARYNPDLSLDKTTTTAFLPDAIHGDVEENALSVAIQADSNIVIAGYADPSGTSSWDFLVARYLSDLSGLDTTFGTNGFVITDFGGPYAQGNGVAIQPDGKIVVAGFAPDYTHSLLGIARYDNIDGSLDPSFGTSGKVQTLLGIGAGASSVAVQPLDGKIVAVGNSADGTSGNFAVARYSTTGTLDASDITDIGGHYLDGDVARAMALQADGKIVAAGTTTNSSAQTIFAVARYDLSTTKIDPVITWSNPADITYGTALSGTQLNATANVAGSFSYNPSSGTVLDAGNAQALHVDFTPTDTTQYNTASKDVAINVLKASPAISIDNIPSNASYPGGFTPTYAYTGDGTTSTTSNTPAVCTVSGGDVTYMATGTCTLVAHATATANFNAATGSTQSFAVGLSISINNIPASPVYLGTFTPTYSYTGNGKTSTTSSTKSVCTVSAKGVVKFVAVGTCTLTAHAAATGGSPAATGDPQSFSVGQATTTISIKSLPKKAKVGGNFTVTYTYSGDGSPFVTSSTATCTVSGSSQVTFASAGLCTLTPHATAGVNYAATDGAQKSFTIAP